jgi:two-component system cell cycle sensor histidine kinase/response regulator CckA
MTGSTGMRGPRDKIEGSAEDGQRREDQSIENRVTIEDITLTIPGVIYQFILEKDGTYSLPYISAGAVSTFGFEPEEMMQNVYTLFEMVHPDDIDRLNLSIAESARTMKTWVQEFRIENRLGEAKWICATSNPHRSPDGRILWNGVLLDVTDRKRAEDALRSSHDELEKRVQKHTAELLKANKRLNREIKKRTRVEESLRKAEQRYRLHFDNAFDVIFSIDRTMKLIEVSPSVERILGYKPRELVGKSIQDLEFLIPGEYERAVSETKPVLEGEHIPASEYELVAKDGTRKFCEVSGAPIVLDGQIVGMVSIARDITNRKLMEEALWESEARYRHLFNNAQVGLFRARISDGLLLEANNRAAQILGYDSREDCIGNYTSSEHYAEAGAREAMLEELYKNGEVNNFEARLTRKDGSFYWTRFSARIYPGSGYIEGIVADITDEKLTAEALRESEERYRTLVENIPIAMYRNTPGPEGEFLMANTGFLKMFGFDSEEELKAYTVADLYAEPSLRKSISDTIMAKGVLEEVEVALKKKDRTPLWGLVTARAVADQLGEVSYFDCTVMDITRRRQAEEEKVRLETKIRQMEKLKAINTLAGGIAHNFNNLLMGILGNTSLMLFEIGNEHPHYGGLKNIEALVHSGSNLTNQLLGYVRQGKYEVKPIDLNCLIWETANAFGRTRKDIVVRLQLEDGLSCIEADRGQIEQIFWNLCVNAAEAMPRGGELLLRTKYISHKDIAGKLYDPKPGNYVMVTVADTGDGMDKEVLHRIFEPFFTTKELGKGTGLGLASTYGIIKGHGGYIDVESEKGKGTTFRIYLPAIERCTQEGATTMQEPLGGNESILLIDDEEFVLEVGGRFLRALGYKTIEVNGGQAGIEIYKSNKDRIDLVILDMIMPGMSGREAYERLRAIDPHVKVILSSGYSIDGQATEILERGCKGFLQKPFGLNELSREIRKVLAGPNDS